MNGKIVTILNNNKSCENKLPDNIDTATFIDFEKCLAPELKSYIHCRLFSVAKVPKSALWKEMKFKNVNKSTAILANTGEDNLISRAKAVSDRPVLLIASSVDVVGDDDDDDIETPSIMNNVFVPTIICEGDDSVESLVFSMGN